MPIRFAAAASACLLGVSGACGAENQWSLSSPDGSREIILRHGPEGGLSYQVRHREKPVMPDSPLGLLVGKEDFSGGLRFIQAGDVASHTERYELFAGIAPRVDRIVNHRGVEFQNGNGIALTIDLAASDQGVAFRYRFGPGGNDGREVLEDNTGFHVPSDARGWMQPYHAAGEFTPAYEDFYFKVSPGDLPPHSREKPLGWCFPALFHLPSAESWILITEVSGENPYPACHLAPESPDGIYRIAFPRRNETDGSKGSPAPDTPRHTFPWIMPWRAIIVGADAGEIATSTLVTDLAPPSRIADTSWIKPGRASWAWWSHPEGPFTEEAFNGFTDMAADMGWEYTLFDANWWDPGLAPLIAHAATRKVAPMMWTHARDFDGREKRRNKLDSIADNGAVGFKADFWCSDRQETIETIKALFGDAAERKLLVNLHGCTLPRGWHRTWPNFMTAEAVLGAESYLYESRYPGKVAELNTVLPFTRNVAGPMDYTPVAFSPKRYQRITTAAHELATSIIFTSGIIHYADSAEAYGKLPPEALRVLRDAPARWDETRCLVGEPGRIAVFARRSGGAWFIAGINGLDEPQAVSLDLGGFPGGGNRILIHEGEPAKEVVAVGTLAASDRWQHTIPPRGGFVLRLDP